MNRKVRIPFGKIPFNSERKVNLVELDVELRECGGLPTYTRDHQPTGEKTPEYTELSISGRIWNAPHKDVTCCGQCLDTINEYFEYLDKPLLFKEIYDLWQNYHLNGMHAGTREQEAAVEEWEAQGNKYDYTKACEMLKEKGLYEVNYTGKSVGSMYTNEPYKYGHAWLVWDLPAEVIDRVEEIIEEYRL